MTPIVRSNMGISIYATKYVATHLFVVMKVVFLQLNDLVLAQLVLLYFMTGKGIGARYMHGLLLSACTIISTNLN